MKTAVRLSAVCAFASLIAGCGGGSGTLLDGSSPSPSATTAEQPVNSKWGHWFHQADTVLVTVGGNGSVTSSPAGIDCTGSSGCPKSFPVGSTVTLSPFATVVAGTGGTTGSGGTTSSGSSQASTTKTPASAPQLISPAIYVSPTGSDSNNGQSASAPFLTLEKAQTAMQGSSTKVVYLMGGTYARTTMLWLTTADAGESWLGYPEQTPILDGGGTLATAIAVEGNNITIRWLTIQNVVNTGILAGNAVSSGGGGGVSGVLIDSNTIKNIYSTGWSQAAIRAYGFNNGRISHNLIRNANYCGIIVLASSGSTQIITNLTIEYNAIYDTMKTVADGGAIYVQDVPHLSTGITINNNIIGNYGSPTNQSKAIYFDDEMSNVTAKNNIVYGTGSFAFQIHGGNNNVFENNIFDISGAAQLGIYQYSSGNPNYGMSGNVITCNIVYSSSAPPYSLWYSELQSNDVPPTVSKNLYWDTSAALHNTGSVVDALPTVGNPDFVNPSQANYAFASTPPSFCAFAPIDTSQVGPVPNP